MVLEGVVPEASKAAGVLFGTVLDQSWNQRKAATVHHLMLWSASVWFRSHVVVGGTQVLLVAVASQRSKIGLLHFR